MSITLHYFDFIPDVTNVSAFHMSLTLRTSVQSVKFSSRRYQLHRVLKVCPIIIYIPLYIVILSINFPSGLKDRCSLNKILINGLVNGNTPINFQHAATKIKHSCYLSIHSHFEIRDSARFWKGGILTFRRCVLRGYILYYPYT